MAIQDKALNKKAEAMRCQRCNGRMIFEKFYDVNNVFFGWHCVMCGEILDPVILLHRISQDADIRIPEKEEEVMLLIKKYLSEKPKTVKPSQRGKGGRLPMGLEDESSLN